MVKIVEKKIKFYNIDAVKLAEEVGLGPISGFSGHKRAFVKVQDGCDAFCSYCLVPYLRGQPSWREAKEIVEEVRELVANGYLEVVLAGVHPNRGHANSH